MAPPGLFGIPQPQRMPPHLRGFGPLWRISAQLSQHPIFIPLSAQPPVPDHARRTADIPSDDPSHGAGMPAASPPESVDMVQTDGSDGTINDVPVGVPQSLDDIHLGSTVPPDRPPTVLYEPMEDESAYESSDASGAADGLTTMEGAAAAGTDVETGSVSGPFAFHSEARRSVSAATVRSRLYGDSGFVPYAGSFFRRPVDAAPGDDLRFLPLLAYTAEQHEYFEAAVDTFFSPAEVWRLHQLRTAMPALRTEYLWPGASGGDVGLVARAMRVELTLKMLESLLTERERHPRG